MDRPSIFICSSSNGLDIARAIQENLCTEFETEIWDQGAFTLGKDLITSIKDVCKRFDFGIIVLSPDALITQDNSTTLIPRDNVLFELGLFIGLLGQERTFIVHENLSNLRLPDYILGISCGRFIQPKGDNYSSALGPVCQQVRKAVKRQGHPKGHLIDRALMIVSHGLMSCLHPDVRKLRAFIFMKQGSQLICTHYWSPYQVSEVVGELAFEINQETQKQVAVVKAAVRKRVCAVSVSVLPEDIAGVSGEIDHDLSFIVAAPILSPEGKVWGTVDFDASSQETEEILRRPIVHHVLFELGKLLYPMLTAR